MEKQPHEKLLTPQEVSSILTIDVETLNKWRHHKRYNLPYIKAGRLIRYRPEDLNTFITSRRQEVGCYE